MILRSRMRAPTCRSVSCARDRPVPGFVRALTITFAIESSIPCTGRIGVGPTKLGAWGRFGDAAQPSRGHASPLEVSNRVVRTSAKREKHLGHRDRRRLKAENELGEPQSAARAGGRDPDVYPTAGLLPLR